MSLALLPCLSSLLLASAPPDPAAPGEPVPPSRATITADIAPEELCPRVQRVLVFDPQTGDELGRGHGCAQFSFPLDAARDVRVTAYWQRAADDQAPPTSVIVRVAPGQHTPVMFTVTERGGVRVEWRGNTLAKEFADVSLHVPGPAFVVRGTDVRGRTATLPVGTRVDVHAGHHVLRARAATGKIIEREIDIAPGAETVVDLSKEDLWVKTVPPPPVLVTFVFTGWLPSAECSTSVEPLAFELPEELAPHARVTVSGSEGRAAMQLPPGKYRVTLGCTEPFLALERTLTVPVGGGEMRTALPALGTLVVHLDTTALAPELSALFVDEPGAVTVLDSTHGESHARLDKPIVLPAGKVTVVVSPNEVECPCGVITATVAARATREVSVTLALAHVVLPEDALAMDIGPVATMGTKTRAIVTLEPGDNVVAAGRYEVIGQRRVIDARAGKTVRAK